MKEPCRSCPEKTRDFGGCRCQAFLMTGDAANADPVCDLSPHHHLVTEAVAAAERPRPPEEPRRAQEQPLVFQPLGVQEKPLVFQPLGAQEKPLVFRSPANSATLFP
jgi:hypothetical protein